MGNIPSPVTPRLATAQLNRPHHPYPHPRMDRDGRVDTGVTGGPNQYRFDLCDGHARLGPALGEDRKRGAGRLEPGGLGADRYPSHPSPHRVRVLKRYFSHPWACPPPPSVPSKGPGAPSPSPRSSLSGPAMGSLLFPERLREMELPLDAPSLVWLQTPLHQPSSPPSSSSPPSLFRGGVIALGSVGGFEDRWRPFDLVQSGVPDSGSVGKRPPPSVGSLLPFHPEEPPTQHPRPTSDPTPQYLTPGPRFRSPI